MAGKKLADHWLYHKGSSWAGKNACSLKYNKNPIDSRPLVLSAANSLENYLKISVDAG
jgi:hypothetical protein